MTKRRDILTRAGLFTTVTVTTSLAGCSATTGNDTASIQECERNEENEDTNWRNPITRIKTVSAPADARIEKIDFFENGAVQIYPDSGPRCYDTMLFKHQSTKASVSDGVSEEPSDGLVVWYFATNNELPPDHHLTAHMKGIISTYCNYPNRKFEIQEIDDDGTCENPNSIIEFEVPESYMPK